MSTIKPTQALDVIDIAWAPEPPDYIKALAAACEMAGSQNKIAKQLGVSGGLVSSVLNNKYKGSLIAVEEKIRATLMSALVDCPAVGQEIALSTCLEHQNHVKAKNRSNGFRISMMRHCPACPKSRLGGN